MGEVATALQNTPGVKLVLVALIGGVEYPLTDFTGDPDDVIDALAGTEWESSTALPGLQVMWRRRQEMEPWSADIKADSVSFAVAEGPGASVFSKLVNGTGAGLETRLNEDLDCTETAVDVLSTSGWDSSGSAHCGIEHLTYSNTTSTLLSPVVRGRYEPFGTDGGTANRFGRMHPLPSVGSGLITKPFVTSKQRVWHGRLVAIYGFRELSPGVLDTFDNADLLWAGRIVGTRYARNGMTYIDCAGIQSVISDCVLMRRQFEAKLKLGVYLKSGWKFEARDRNGASISSNCELTVTDDVTPGSDEITSGIYTRDELAEALNTWFAAKLASTDLGLAWTWEPTFTDPSTGEIRSRFVWEGGSTTDDNAAFFRCHAVISTFMGFGDDLTVNVNTATWDGANAELESPEIPFRSLILPTADGLRFEVEDVRGEWFENDPWLPPELHDPFYDDQGVMQFGTGGGWAMVHRIDDTNFQITKQEALRYFGAGPWTEAGIGQMRADNTAPVVVKQIAIIAMPFGDFLTTCLASTGTPGFNHATWDAFPDQLGAAMPWQLLGDAWLNSVGSLAAADGAVRVVIEKPTKLAEVISGDMVARFATIVWKSGGLRLATWAPPALALVEHTLTEETKARPIEDEDDLVAEVVDEDRFLCNVVKLAHSRIPGTDSFRDVVTIVHEDSIAQHGATRPVTIELRNTYALGDADPYLAEIENSIRTMLPLFAQPLRLVRVSIDQTLFENVAPGDMAQLSDDHLIDPSTGEPGLTSKPCMVVRHETDFGGYEADVEDTRPQHGQVDLLIMNRDRVVAYAPCAQVDETQANGGYNASAGAGPTLTFYGHKHSESTSAVDVSHFAANDNVVVIEIDPDDPASPTKWSRTILSVDAGTNTVVFTSALSSPAWDSARRYRMISQAYGSATTVQRAKAFQADDADMMVVDTIAALEYGGVSSPSSGHTADTGLELFALPANDYFGDGKPLETGCEADLCTASNNIVSFRSAVVAPILYRDWLEADAGCVKQILAVEPIFLGTGSLGFGDRQLNIRLWVKRASAGAAVKLWVSLCNRPPTGDSWKTTNADVPGYELRGPYAQHEYSFTTTTAAPTSTQELSLRVVDPNVGIGYLVIEGEPDAQTRGLCLCQVGRFEE